MTTKAMTIPAIGPGPNPEGGGLGLSSGLRLMLALLLPMPFFTVGESHGQADHVKK
jgi:hypothetical protein